MNEKTLLDTWIMFQKEHQVSVDRMLCNPKYREEFLAAAKLATGFDDEQTLLWKLVALRKKKSLPSVLK